MHTKVSDYMELKLVGGAYVYRAGRIAQVPTPPHHSPAGGQPPQTP